MASISNIQAAVSYCAAETATGQKDTAGDAVSRGEKDRKELQRNMREREKQIQELQAKLEGQADDAKSFWGGVKSLWGDDSGVGETGDKISSQAAELKKEARQLEIAMVQTEQMLKELQAAEAEFGKRMNDDRKTRDESDEAVSIGNG